MNKLRTLLQKENLPYVPLALAGLALGAVECFVRPWLEDTAQKAGKTAMAHIEYWRSDDE